MNPLPITGSAERPVDAVRGTMDRLPAEVARLDGLEAILIDRFARAGYEPIRTPVLEPTELHERKSGAGIVAKLFELAGGSTGQDGVCLRPELTAGIVRAYTAAEVAPDLPWRVSHSGPVFRYEKPRPGRLREFQQVGVERLGDSGPLADAEVIWLADWSLAEAGVSGATIRLGHVGLILEMLDRSGLPAPLGTALIEMLSEAAAEGQGVKALELGLEQLSGWLQTTGETAGMIDTGVGRSDDGGIDRLFRTLVPVVTGRRPGHEIVNRLRRKWDLGHGLLSALERVRRQVHALADLKGEPAAVLDRLGRVGSRIAGSLTSLAVAPVAQGDAWRPEGVDPARVVLDLGFGRGIGFYSQMVFEIVAETPEGPVEICGGGRYDGLARVLGRDRDDRGVGFAFGLERLRYVLDRRGAAAPRSSPRGCRVVARAGLLDAAERLAAEWRREGRGLWSDGGPIVGPDLIGPGDDLGRAFERARSSGLAAVVLVKDETGLVTTAYQRVAGACPGGGRPGAGGPGPERERGGTVSDPIRLALPSKGHLYDGIVEILKTAGYKVRRASDRQYEATIAGHPRFHVVFMRPTDIVTQVQEGRCHRGVTGMDVYAERSDEATQTVVVVPDLGYGGCRLVVAVPESWIDVGHVIDLVDLTSEFKASGRTFRVSTKYPRRLTQRAFQPLGDLSATTSSIESEGASGAAPEPARDRRHHRRPQRSFGDDPEGQPS